MNNRMDQHPANYFEQNQFPEPVTFGMINFTCPHEQRQVSYTDCWEISVYRFLHLVFQERGRVRLDWVKRYMVPGDFHSDLLVTFFERYPEVHMKPFYYEDTREGRLERAEWAQMLNASKCLYLKRKQMRVVQVGEGGIYEVAATLENTVEFFRNFFPLLSFWKEESNADKMRALMDELSRPGLLLRLESLDEFEVPEYKYHGMKISVNENPCLEWEIWSNLQPIYDEDGNVVGQKRTGGHSDFRFRTAHHNPESDGAVD